MQTGLTRSECYLSTPGEIATMWFWKRFYAGEIKKKKVEEI